MPGMVSMYSFNLLWLSRSSSSFCAPGSFPIRENWNETTGEKKRTYIVSQLWTRPERGGGRTEQVREILTFAVGWLDPLDTVVDHLLQMAGRLAINLGDPFLSAHVSAREEEEEEGEGLLHRHLSGP